MPTSGWPSRACADPRRPSPVACGRTRAFSSPAPRTGPARSSPTTLQKSGSLTLFACRLCSRSLDRLPIQRSSEPCRRAGHIGGETIRRGIVKVRGAALSADVLCILIARLHLLESLVGSGLRLPAAPSTSALRLYADPMRLARSMVGSTAISFFSSSSDWSISVSARATACRSDRSASTRARRAAARALALLTGGPLTLLHLVEIPRRLVDDLPAQTAADVGELLRRLHRRLSVRRGHGALVPDHAGFDISRPRRTPRRRARPRRRSSPHFVVEQLLELVQVGELRRRIGALKLRLHDDPLERELQRRRRGDARKVLD